MKKFFTLAVLVILSRFYDVLTTYKYTPDLSNESNPIVLWFGAGWTTVIILQTLLTLLVIYFLYNYFFKFTPIIPEDKTLTLKQYISYFHFNEPNSLHKILYKMPENKKEFMASIGYVASMTLIWVSIIVGTSTSFLLLSEVYQEIYKQGIPYLLYCIILGIATFFYFRFFKKEYKKYKNKTANKT